MFYKYDISKPGWYPKPTEIASDADVQRLFKHDDPEFGEVLRYNEYPGVEMGTRQTWFYDVTYANGQVVTFPLKCISLPVKNANALIDLDSLSHQELKGKIVDARARDTILNNISKILTSRHLTNDIPSWQVFFSKLPVHEGYVFSNILLNVVSKHKRTIQVSKKVYF